MVTHISPNLGLISHRILSYFINFPSCAYSLVYPLVYSSISVLAPQLTPGSKPLKRECSRIWLCFHSSSQSGFIQNHWNSQCSLISFFYSSSRNVLEFHLMLLYIRENYFSFLDAVIFFNVSWPYQYHNLICQLICICIWCTYVCTYVCLFMNIYQFPSTMFPQERVTEFRAYRTSWRRFCRRKL